ncbi:helix-turn-helix transcriptional regulator [Winogradskyella sp. UBA3174]|uniref:helix-turn-helix transcriptional regulator n=1 Tax=Winogradskyella sp. UBA3174 TaxID=1947785 RepID=UPI0025FBB6CD|nr:WYL domain-containing protein [Winogradskyella sp. UBA3174]|tara:strand:- start:131025 stop:132026 length:1002 start_codon:yes stop_codon:yes gene_type:complete
MATNRHAQIRYTLLDRCFSNFNRLYDYDGLLEEVNSVLYDLGTEGIKLRQIQYDIEHMKSDSGWAIDLDEDLKLVRKKAFRYKNKSFSISNHPLNVNDSEQLETTIAILSRYKNRAEFSWLEELIPRMKQGFDLVAKGENGAISYQENIYLKGREFIGIIFNLILKRKKTRLIYEPYGKPQQETIICPYHLKQYNNRWFLFCYNEEYKSISNYPLDRIINIEELADSFKSSTINWVDYFDDIIGVTKPEERNLEKILLKFSVQRINYVLTKPLHGTQKPGKADEDERTLTIEVIPNNELYQLLLSFGSDLEVIAPPGVREEMAERIKDMNNNY